MIDNIINNITPNYKLSSSDFHTILSELERSLINYKVGELTVSSLKDFNVDTNGNYFLDIPKHKSNIYVKSVEAFPIFKYRNTLETYLEFYLEPLSEDLDGNDLSLKVRFLNNSEGVYFDTESMTFSNSVNDLNYIDLKVDFYTKAVSDPYFLESVKVTLTNADLNNGTEIKKFNTSEISSIKFEGIISEFETVEDGINNLDGEGSSLGLRDSNGYLNLSKSTSISILNFSLGSKEYKYTRSYKTTDREDSRDLGISLVSTSGKININVNGSSLSNKSPFSTSKIGDLYDLKVIYKYNPINVEGSSKINILSPKDGEYGNLPTDIGGDEGDVSIPTEF